MCVVGTRASQDQVLCTHIIAGSRLFELCFCNVVAVVEDWLVRVVGGHQDHLHVGCIQQPTLVPQHRCLAPPNNKQQTTNNQRKSRNTGTAICGVVCGFCATPFAHPHTTLSHTAQTQPGMSSPPKTKKAKVGQDEKGSSGLDEKALFGLMNKAKEELNAIKVAALSGESMQQDNAESQQLLKSFGARMTAIKIAARNLAVSVLDSSNKAKEVRNNVKPKTCLSA